MPRSGTADLPLHGGKDGTPYPVDRERYDESIRFLREALDRSEVEGNEKRKAMERLAGAVTL